MKLILLLAVGVTAAGGAAGFPRNGEAGEREEIRGIGRRLLEAADSGRLVLLNGERERKQLARTAELDEAQAPLLSLALLRTVDGLVSRSTAEKPLRVMSLFRPVQEGRPNEPHGKGQAVDIAGFGGFAFRSTSPGDCEAGALAVVEALGSGSYRLGLPMPAGCAPVPLLPPPDRRFDWPFFPPPLAEVDEGLGLVLPRLDGDRAPRGRLSPVILCWASGRYAPLEDVQSERVRAGILAAMGRGANIHSLFPDGENHLHLDVKESP